MTTYQTKLRQLELRTVDFTVNIIKTFDKYSNKFTLRPAIDQLIRSASSVGANYTEANNASSRADFKNKIYIAKKESSEARYWLNVLSRLLPEEDFSGLKQEALELNLIMQKIISTMKNEE